MIEIIFTVIENSIMIWFLNQVFELKREKKLVYKDSIICVIILASVYKGIHIKTTKNGLPTY